FTTTSTGSTTCIQGQQLVLKDESQLLTLQQGLSGQESALDKLISSAAASTGTASTGKAATGTAPTAAAPAGRPRRAGPPPPGPLQQDRPRLPRPAVVAGPRRWLSALPSWPLTSPRSMLPTLIWCSPNNSSARPRSSARSPGWSAR